MACGDDRVFPRGFACAGGEVRVRLDEWRLRQSRDAHFTPFTPFTPAGLSDADVERIAKRVAELLREAKP